MFVNPNETLKHHHTFLPLQQYYIVVSWTDNTRQTLELLVTIVRIYLYTWQYRGYKIFKNLTNSSHTDKSNANIRILFHYSYKINGDLEKIV